MSPAVTPVTAMLTETGLYLFFPLQTYIVEQDLLCAMSKTVPEATAAWKGRGGSRGFPALGEVGAEGRWRAHTWGNRSWGAQARVGVPWHSVCLYGYTQARGDQQPWYPSLSLSPCRGCPTGSSFQDKTRETQPHFSP